MTDKRSAANPFALLVGAVFLLVGILGFIPGITTNYSDMTFASHEGDTALLGLFDVNILHNIVHIAFGLAGLAAARVASTARTFLIGGGVVYLVVWLYGILIDRDSGANIINLNSADNVLHLALGVGMIGLGLISAGERASDRRTTATA
jgi:hypothetical protein